MWLGAWRKAVAKTTGAAAAVTIVRLTGIVASRLGCVAPEEGW